LLASYASSRHSISCSVIGEGRNGEMERDYSYTVARHRDDGNGSMKTLRQAEPISLGLPLSGVYLYSAMYINELVDRVLMPEVASPGLFHDYLFALTEL
ncbi:DNA repair protein RecO, partial [Vibrio cholerae]|uniref:DNA repair protein RecO n=1 Tax=Vibrio cholerae TaxID=666 RepID=UPI0032048306